MGVTRRLSGGPAFRNPQQLHRHIAHLNVKIEM